MKDTSFFLVILATITLVIPQASGQFLEEAPQIEITSSAFKNGETIPRGLTCDGKNESPPLRWKLGPKNTESFAILMEDPDAPGGTWTHWILYDIPPRVDMLPGGLPAIRKLANAEKQGTNDFKKLGYGGPCPPSGTHRYFFRIYALNATLNLNAGIDRDQFLDAIEGHILAEGSLMGTYTHKEK